jgi:hypothetical protein
MVKKVEDIVKMLLKQRKRSGKSVIFKNLHICFTLMIKNNPLNFSKSNFCFKDVANKNICI